MPIHFECPHCSQPLEAEVAMSGKCIPCPKCERLISIPQPTSHAVRSNNPIPSSLPMASDTSVPKTSGMAIASMVIGILSLLGGWMCCGVVLPLIAIVLGHVSFAQIQKNPSKLEGKGLAIAGFTMGYVGLVFGIIASIVFGTFAASMTAILDQMNKMLKQGGRPLR